MARLTKEAREALEALGLMDTFKANQEQARASKAKAEDDGPVSASKKENELRRDCRMFRNQYSALADWRLKFMPLEAEDFRMERDAYKEKYKGIPHRSRGDIGVANAWVLLEAYIPGEGMMYFNVRFELACRMLERNPHMRPMELPDKRQQTVYHPSLTQGDDWQFTKGRIEAGVRTFTRAKPKKKAITKSDKSNAAKEIAKLIDSLIKMGKIEEAQLLLSKQSDLVG